MKRQYFDYDSMESKVERKIQSVMTDPDLSEHNRELILRYIHECQIGKTIKKGQKKIIGPGRILQSAGYLMLMAKHWFKKNLDEIGEKEMEDFVLRLDHGKITTVRNGAGRPYSGETKSNIKKFIRKFYKWLGDGYSYPSLVDWIDTSKKEAEVPAIPGLKEGVERIVELIPEIRRKAMVWVAFDTGFRLGELVNLTVGDVEKGPNGRYYLTCRHSKTKKRTVGLSEPDLLERWLKKHPYKDDPSAQLWQTSRQAFYKTVIIYGKKALGIHVHPHMLRHTSATYYVVHLDRATFCVKFGWSYSSKMPERYIDRAKLPQNRAVELVEREEIGSLKKQLSQANEKSALMENELDELRKKMDLIHDYTREVIDLAVRQIQEKESQIAKQQKPIVLAPSTNS